jgi:hypothetical protein
MPYSMQVYMVLATTLAVKARAEDLPQDSPSEADLSEVVAPALQRLLDAAQQFRGQPVNPTRAHHFERQLQAELRELGRVLTGWTYNHLEPGRVDELPKHVHFEAGGYTRLNAKTPQHVWTLFGQVRLSRVGYRPTDKSGDPTIFPLALSLGLVHGASAALADRAARLLADSGMTQRQVLQKLRLDHGVGWGTKKLRQVTGAVSLAMARQRHTAQVEQLLSWLGQATASRGRHKPVLSVGRDGISLPVRCQGGSVFEVASAATVSVHDRKGKRLGTVYLAYAPETKQVTMSRELTRLLDEVLSRWQGPLPRLSYVTDAGDNETGYYDEVLKRMRHPATGKRLGWVRVVDYYHASERVWKMAELIFGKGRQATAWARKMQRWLLKRGGVNRVLHSAAAYRDLYGLRGKKRQEFTKAYRYLSKRMKYMRYAEYRAVGVPLGSGVTEAACKTIYTQRLKLSGMRWESTGAQAVLNLRVLLLSGVWDHAYQRVLAEASEAKVRGQCPPLHPCPKSAA